MKDQKKLFTIFVAAALTFLVLFLQSKNRYQDSEPPTLCHLANAGFSIEFAGTFVLMDALYKETFPEDQPLSEGLLAALESERGPYRETKLITVSHNHVDHFDPQMIVQFLRKHPKAHLIIPKENLVRYNNPRAKTGRVVSLPWDQIHNSYPERGTPEKWEINGIGVTVYNLDHLTEVQNIGVLVNFGGKTFFHMGDFSSSDFEENGLKGLKVDYLLVPYWYLRDEENFQLIVDNIEAEFLVPMHIPKEDMPEDMVERIGTFEDLMATIQGMADNVLMLYEEGACTRPEGYEYSR